MVVPQLELEQAVIQRRNRITRHLIKQRLKGAKQTFDSAVLPRTVFIDGPMADTENEQDATKQS